MSNFESLSRDELIEMLKEILNNIDNLPDPAKITSVTHYDLYAVVAVIYSILKVDVKP